MSIGKNLFHQMHSNFSPVTEPLKAPALLSDKPHPMSGSEDTYISTKRKETSVDSQGTSVQQLDRSNQDKFNTDTPQGNIVPPYARTWWFHKTPDSRIPQEYLDNVLDFAQKNPVQDVAFITDNPTKIRSLLPETLPENLHIEQHDSSIDMEDFPNSRNLAGAMIAHCPAFSKDLYSYSSLRQKPGISFDPDTKWDEPLPNPFIIQGDAAVHNGYENGLIVYTNASKKDLMGQMLRKSEEKIPEMFEIKEMAGATIFTLRADQTPDIDDIVDKIQYKNYAKTMQDNKAENLREYVSYKTPNSSYNRGGVHSGTMFIYWPPSKGSC